VIIFAVVAVTIVATGIRAVRLAMGGFEGCKLSARVIDY
jgi:hypothetical protein